MRLRLPHPRTWFVVAVILLVASLSACGDDGGDGGSGGALAADQTLRIRLIGEPTTLDPQIAAFGSDIGVLKQLWRGLFYYRSNDLDLAPAAATEVPTQENGGISADGLTYTIKLRDDLTWSDGEPLTAEDFAFSFKRLFDPEAGGTGYYYTFYTDIEGAEDAVEGGSLEDVGVTAIDETTLEIKLTRPRSTLLPLLSLWPAYPIREDVVSQGEAWTEAGNLIANGPYTLSEWEHDDHITLTANANYWGDDKPTVQTIVYRMQPNEEAALIAYENGELDMTPIPVTEVATFEGSDEQVRTAQHSTIGLQFNVTREPFDNADVRKAFSAAIDRETFINNVRGGVGVATTSWLPPGVPGYDPERGKEYAFNADKAKRFLADAGFPNGEGLPEINVMVGDSQSEKLNAEFVQEQIKQNLGVEIGVDILESATFEDRFLSSDFQVTLGGWFADYADPDNWLPSQWTTGSGNNIALYSNPDFDELMEQAASELDAENRIDLYAQAEAILIDTDHAFAPIYHNDRNWLVKPWVDGLEATEADSETPGDWFFSRVRILEH